MDIENWVYIIVLLLSVIFSVIGKNRKKNAEPAPSPSFETEEKETTVKDEMKRLFDYYTEGQTNVFNEQEQEEQMLIDNIEQDDQEETFSESKLDDVGEEGTRTLIAEQEEANSILEVKRKKSTAFKDFNLKQAVIFSEILNRKVY